MGIKSLTKLIKNNTNNSIENINLYQLSNKRVAIDASLFIYKSLIAINTKGSNNKNIGHIIGIFNKTINYLSLNIIPIYIFDGKPPKLKQTILNERKQKLNNNKILLHKSTNIYDINKYEKRCVKMTKEHIDDIKQLLSLLGVSYIHCDWEAEGIASELCRINYVDYVISEDMDSLPFGSSKLVRSCVDKSIKRKDILSVFNLESILNELKLTHDQFIELCVLCGCDYCSNISKVGPIKSLQIINKYKSINNYIEQTKPILPNNYINNYKESIKIFNSYRGIFNNTDIPINKSILNIPKLKEYLLSFNINEKSIDKSIQKINRTNIKIS